MRKLLSLVVSVAAMGGLLACSVGGCTKKNALDPTDRPGPVTAPAAEAIPGCIGPVQDSGGSRRLALLVGVGDYDGFDVPDLLGPKNDVEHMRKLLTKHYAFPEQNVCTLIDGQATVAGFKSMFGRALVDRARPGDVVVVYFSGHGGQEPDERGGDEEDGLDETWLMKDSRTPNVGDVTDDEVNVLLKALRLKTENVTVIIDSCNSGSAHRALAESTVRERTVPPRGAISGALTTARVPATRERPLAEDDPHVVVLAAASDGTSALEVSGRGVFTDALVEVLGQAARQPLRYSQVSRQVPPLVQARSPQVPYFHGNLDRQVFGSQTAPRPFSWEVGAMALGPGEVDLSGPPLPGMGVGAELRVYDPNLAPEDFRDAGKAKATLVVTGFSGLNAKARIAGIRPHSPPMKPGDLAVLLRPSDDSLRIAVRLRPPGQPGGLTASEVSAIRSAVDKNLDAKSAVILGATSGDFEVHALDAQWLAITGAEGVIRNRLKRTELHRLPEKLWMHARHKALKLLRGESGGAFTDEKTLQVQLVPAADEHQLPCGRARRTWWNQAPANEEQVVPLCVRYQVKVTLASDAPAPLLVGGVVLSTDGATLPFPGAGYGQKLLPGQSYTFPTRFFGSFPLDARDTVRVFGTQERNKVPWYLLAASGAKRSSERAALTEEGALFRALDRYLLPGSRGAGSDGEELVDGAAWTVSSLSMRVEANPRPRASGLEANAAAPAADDSSRRKEYTIANFEIAPYLPDDATTALHKVLVKASSITGAEIPYKQHQGWNTPGAKDEDNLKLGLDCSRAIWFAFTRAGLPYTKDDAYLSTAEMVAEDSRMKERFDRCDADTRLMLGDVLVYRDEGQGDGHVVMVIDPEKRIAWGSHGWDGNAKPGNEPDRGVEFQLIKFKKDWERWDRKTMERKACWRYRTFVEQAERGAGTPGLKALGGEQACEKENCNALVPMISPASGTGPN